MFEIILKVLIKSLMKRERERGGEEKNIRKSMNIPKFRKILNFLYFNNVSTIFFKLLCYLYNHVVNFQDFKLLFIDMLCSFKWSMIILRRIFNISICMFVLKKKEEKRKKRHTEQKCTRPLFWRPRSDKIIVNAYNL